MKEEETDKDLSGVKGLQQRTEACPWCGHDPTSKATSLAASIGTVIGILAVLGLFLAMGLGAWWLAWKTFRAVFG